MDVEAKQSRLSDRPGGPRAAVPPAVDRRDAPAAALQSGDTATTLPAAPSIGRKQWLLAAALVAIVFGLYYPCWHGGFVLDDDLHLLSNPVLKPGGLAKAWIPGGYLNYWPVTFSAYWLQYQLWGLAPLGYHLVNLALHAVAALLVWRVLVRLQVPGAMFAAALFALHPINVESVAWIAQLKGVLSLVLALVSVLFYLDNERCPRRWRYGLAIAAFMLSALAKGAALTLPVVLLACAWWQRGRIQRRDLWRVLPYFLISALMAGIELWGQHHVAQSDVVRTDDFFSRLAVAGCALWFYLGKLVLPVGLCPIYPRWTINEFSLLSYLPGLAWVALVAWAWQARLGWGRPILMTLICYSALLLPVLGFANIYFMRFSLVADHWQYAATIVPCAAFAAGIAALGRRLKSPPVSIGAALATLVMLALLSLGQSGMYASADTFYETTIARNPDCWLAYNDLGYAMLNRGEVGRAVVDFEKALEINPDYAVARNNLGTALLRSGQVELAIAQYQAAIETNPKLAEAWYDLGDALLHRGQVDAAIANFKKALEINPDFAQAHNNLGEALAGRGKIDSAVGEYEKAIEANPDYAAARINLANGLIAQGHVDLAIAQYQRALEIEPRSAKGHYNYAIALARQSQIDSAIDHYQKALAIEPGFAEAHYNLGLLLAGRGKFDLALAQYQRALETKPGDADIHFDLAIALTHVGQADAAIAQYEKALEIKPIYAEAHSNLGTIFGRRGDLDSAIAHYQKALEIKPDYEAARKNLAIVLAEREKLRKAPTPGH